MDTDFISLQFSLNSLGHYVLDITQGHIYMWITDADAGFSRTVSRDHLSIVPLCGSVAQSCPTLFNPMDCSTPASLSFTITQSLLKLMSIESVVPTNHLIHCHPLLLLLSIFPRIRVFSSESALHIRWQKYWSFSFSIRTSNEYSGLISFRVDWFDLLAVQGNLKSLLQHHSLKTSVLQSSAFFMVQLSHPYMTNRKSIALTRWNFVSKVMSLLFNMLSRLVIAFLSRASVF